MLQTNTPNDVNGQIHTEIPAICGLGLSWVIFLRGSSILLGTPMLLCMWSSSTRLLDCLEKGVLLFPAQTLSHVVSRVPQHWGPSALGKHWCHTVLPTRECLRTLTQFGVNKDSEKKSAYHSQGQITREELIHLWPGSLSQRSWVFFAYWF